jgi:hypothetical protein
MVLGPYGPLSQSAIGWTVMETRMTNLGEANREELSRDQVADRLVEIALQVREGTVVIGGREVAVPERVYLEIEIGDGEIEIALKWGDAFDAFEEDEDEEEEEIIYGEGDLDDDDDDDTDDDETEDDTEDEELFSGARVGGLG